VLEGEPQHYSLFLFLFDRGEAPKPPLAPFRGRTRPGGCEELPAGPFLGAKRVHRFLPRRGPAGPRRGEGRNPGKPEETLPLRGTRAWRRGGGRRR
jgi:hypothetical protein